MVRKNNRLFLLVTALLLAASLVFSAARTQPVQAASKRTKALKAYKRLLSKKKLKFNYGYKAVKTKYVRFSTAYINDDSIPELVIHSLRKTGYIRRNPKYDDGPMVYSYPKDGLVYTFRGGKLKKVGEINISDETKVRYYKRKGVLMAVRNERDPESSDYNRRRYFYLTVSNGGRLGTTYLWKALYYNLDIWEYGEYSDPYNDIALSKEEFQDELYPFTNNAGRSKFKWHGNSKKNRKKYLTGKKIGK